jgi:hypothetical protein
MSLDKWNQQFRLSPVYLNFMKKNNLPTDGRVKLSRKQQSQLEKDMAAAGAPVPKGMHIDQGGNLNQKNRAGKVAIISAAVAGAAFGAPALIGALGAGGGGAGAGAGAATAAGGTGAATTGGLLASTALPTSLGMTAAPLAAIPTAASLGGAVGTGLTAAAPALASGAKAATGMGLKSSIGKFLGDYTPELIGAGGAYLEGRRQSKEAERDRAFRRDQAIVDFLGRESEGGRQDERMRAEMGLQATQMDPYAHARARNRANVRASFGKGWNPQTGFTGGSPNFDLSALEPENLDRTGDYFYRNVAEASPNVPLDSTGAEGFRQTRLNEMQERRKREREEIMRYLSQMGRS